MKRAVFIATVMIMLLLGNKTKGSASLIMNGSFENDGEIDPVTAVDYPQYWCDVDIPADKFLCWVNTDWSTHGYGDGYSLTFYSNIFIDFVAGDTAMVSQQVYLGEDANQIIFDLKLGSLGGDPWDPSKRSALILIDEDVIWDSGNWQPDANSEFRNQTVEVNDIYKDESWHTLSLAMRSNVTEMEWFYEYTARWDFVKFDAYCGGFGYLWEDLNLDCCVNILDLEMLAEQWLAADPNEEYDLFQDGIVDFRDFASFADYWLCTTYWENWQSDNCFEMELLALDIDDSGQVDYGDISVLADYWLTEVSCNRADLYEDGFVDFLDFAVIADQWLAEKSWLYRL